MVTHLIQKRGKSGGVIKMTVSEKTLMKMERYGGSFVRTLACLYRCADPFNKKKLERCFREYFEEYERFGE